MNSIKTFLPAILAIFIIAGCSSKVEETRVVISHHEKETTDWGCIGVDTRTWIKDIETNRIDYKCGNLGSPGDTIKGYWVDHWDASRSGFRYKKP